MAFWGAAHALSNWYFLVINLNRNPDPNLKALDDERQVDVIFLDFVKAFDRVAHEVLRRKFYNFGISGALLTDAKITSPKENPWSEFYMVFYSVTCT